MKRVSFKVAEALKEAGYPQGHTAMCYDINGAQYDWCCPNTFADAPFAMEVWLWLWREKHITIDVDSTIRDTASASVIIGNRNVIAKYFNGDDPEEVIIEAIEHIIGNNLLK